ncbi:MAG: class I SAM-dependent methyltransferase [Clostridia bacterium]|nr:class I SAM-dependent methyltransferase [Clostridia bacterium]
MKNVISHYDKLIDEDNDPFRDDIPLQEYMDKWDGHAFIDLLELTDKKSVLEIGVGTGRLAIKVLPFCKDFTGIDISLKTIKRAKENLADYNVNLICNDFLNYAFDKKFDVVYSSLTFMHIKEKQVAIQKVYNLLNNNGLFVLSIDKNQSEFIEMGNREIRIYPDTKELISNLFKEIGFLNIILIETEFAYIIKGKR